MAAILQAGSTAVLPIPYSPMLAQAADGPLDSPLFAYEMKWDGMRVLVGLDSDRWSLLSRNGLEAARRFPELAEVREAIREERVVLDGEVVRLVNGRPDFGALQFRMHLADERHIRSAAEREPVALILFDVLRIGNEELLRRPWTERRARLERLFHGVGDRPCVQLSPTWNEGTAVWETTAALGLEGVMAKRRDSIYVPGKRSPAWLKIKRTATSDAVVGGWTEGTGARQDSFGALILGQYRDGALVFVGHVGTGFTQRDLPEICRLLKTVETEERPFAENPVTNSPPHWVKPVCVCEVAHMGRSHEGRLRFPVFRRWRPDKLPQVCLAEV